jgi:hypothetical protein
VSVIIVKKTGHLPKNVIKAPKQMRHLLDLSVKDKSPQEYANMAVIGIMNVTHKPL